MMPTLQKWKEKIRAAWNWNDWLQTEQTPRELLVNKGYFDRIDAKMAHLGKPTVGDALHAMRRQGNKPYFDEFTYLNQSRNVSRFGKTWQKHEISHLCPRIGHTPVQEQMGLAFETGLEESLDIRTLNASRLESFHKLRIDDMKNYTENSRLFQEDVVGEAPKRDWAVYFAAGMYLREKMDSMVRNNVHTQGYNAQLAFCEQYADCQNDHVPPRHSKVDFKWAGMEKAPYALIQLSKPEWRAIEAVALGLCEPEQTPYPKRMAAIKEALVYSNLFFDKPKHAEQLRQQEAAANANKGRG